MKVLTKLYILLMILIALSIVVLYDANIMIIKPLATTGADVEVIVPCRNLISNDLQSNNNSSISEIYLIGKQSETFSKHLEQDYLSYRDYFLISGEIIDYKEEYEASNYYYPIVKVDYWIHIHPIYLLFSFIGVITALLICYLLKCRAVKS